MAELWLSSLEGKKKQTKKKHHHCHSALGDVRGAGMRKLAGSGGCMTMEVAIATPHH